MLLSIAVRNILHPVSRGPDTMMRQFAQLWCWPETENFDPAIAHERDGAHDSIARNSKGARERRDTALSLPSRTTNEV